MALSMSLIRTARIEKSIISVFSSTDGSPDIRFFFCGGAMFRATVQAWLTNPQISTNLQLHAISDRFNDEQIISFLRDSALPATVGTAGESATGAAGRRVRRRLDTLAASNAPRVRRGGHCGGRKPKSSALPPPVGRQQSRPGALTPTPLPPAPLPLSPPPAAATGPVAGPGGGAGAVHSAVAPRPESRTKRGLEP